ncbi:hypothetical protein [Telluribacter sp.]|uniref:hypothetical protein n=1 Tax=Telluribacter sp. TaxID=1978767 RepID=UPI002E138FDA|nr:hypothetical protein [Telluribacter sp.]
MAYIPELPYELFYERAREYLNDPATKILSYYGIKKDDKLTMFCALANDQTENIYIASYTLPDDPSLILTSLSLFYLDAYYFEFEISQKLGIQFSFLTGQNQP